MDESVDHRRGDSVVAEDFSPGAEGPTITEVAVARERKSTRRSLATPSVRLTSRRGEWTPSGLAGSAVVEPARHRGGAHKPAGTQQVQRFASVLKLVRGVLQLYAHLSNLTSKLLG